MKKSGIFFVLLICIFFGGNISFAGEDTRVYQLAVESAKDGQMEFAYMRFRNLLNNYPNSRHYADALFSMGEYYFFIPDYRKASEYFEQFLKQYADKEEAVFALAYLYKTAEHGNRIDSMNQLKKRIIDFRRVGLLFQKYKVYKYRSAMNHAYRGIFYIDKIDVYRGGKLFVAITY